MKTLNIRIDEKIKKQAKEKLSSMGLDMSSAIKIFLYQVVEENGLPFIPTKNHKKIREKWDREVLDAKKSKGFKDISRLMKSLTSQ